MTRTFDILLLYINCNIISYTVISAVIYDGMLPWKYTSTQIPKAFRKTFKNLMIYWTTFPKDEEAGEVLYVQQWFK